VQLRVLAELALSLAESVLIKPVALWDGRPMITVESLAPTNGASA
jgi:hypothetical protein